MADYDWESSEQEAARRLRDRSIREAMDLGYNVASSNTWSATLEAWTCPRCGSLVDLPLLCKHEEFHSMIDTLWGGFRIG